MSTQTGAPTTPTLKTRRWPTVLLAVSLTLNLLVLGLIAGAHVRDERDTRRFPPPDRTVMRTTGFGPLFEAMPRAARNRMGEALRARDGRFEPDRAALAGEVREMIRTLRADPFDAGALEAVLAAQHDRANARIVAGRMVLLDQIAGMTDDERRAFADSLESRFSRAIERGPGDRGSDDRVLRDD